MKVVHFQHRYKRSALGNVDEKYNLRIAFVTMQGPVDNRYHNEYLLVCIFILSTLRRTWLQEYPKPPFAFKLLLLSISCSSQ